VIVVITVLQKQVVAVTQHRADTGLINSAVLLCETALRVFKEQLPQACVPADALQDLLQELATLMRMTVEAIAAQEAANDDVELPEQLQHLLSEFGVFAVHVIGQLPLRWACNHPGCINLGQTSELALVGGKSCVCSGCKSAR
jgi:predicted RNA-binding Zn ribbon-like protein